MSEWEAARFFKAGGALEADDPSYITRRADEDLIQAVLAGQYCHVLTARQTGKSSLMVRTVSRLRAPGVQTVAIDLTAIGTTGISVNEWYFGLISRFKQQLGLRVDELAWWQERDQLGPTQRSPIFFARSC